MGAGAHSKKIRIGVFGGRRGQALMNALARHPDAALVAVCDSSPERLAACKSLADSLGGSIVCYEDFDRFIEHDVDAVVLANYATEHARFAIRCLGSGRHVLSELMPCQTMAEAVQLIEAIERSGKVYSYAENACYIPAVMEMQRLYTNGDLGQFLYGEGQYIHDIESQWGSLTQWRRDHWRNWAPSTFYVTHSTGPLFKATGTRPVKVTAYETPNANKRRYGALSADAATIVCQMDNGAVCSIVPWASLKRQYLLWVSVYGSKGSAEMDRWGDWSKISVFKDGDAAETQHYQVDYPVDVLDAAKGTDHGGADYLTVHYFLEAILDRPGKAHAVDIYQALDMTYPGMLGYRSIWEGNRAIEVPDLRLPRQRELCRRDDWCVDPKLAGPGQPDSSCASEKVELPDSVYEAQRPDQA